MTKEPLRDAFYLFFVFCFVLLFLFCLDVFTLFALPRFTWKKAMVTGRQPKKDEWENESSAIEEKFNFYLCCQNPFALDD